MMKKTDFRVLVIDDEEGLRQGLTKVLQIGGFSVDTASTAAEGIARIRDKEYRLVFVDYRLPDENGIEVLKTIDPSATKSIVITAYATVANAIEAMKAGATDYLIKPFSNQDIVDIANKFYDGAFGAVEGGSREGVRIADECFLFRSPSMQSVIDNVRRIASSSIPVLILGESGTGKEKIARCIFSSGNYAGKPFVGINCAAIPSDLLESELFGYEKGAFSGATGRKYGKFEAAQDGILFLDEIGDMNIDLQAKLLRVLEERIFDRIGGLEGIPLRARIISSTNVNIKERIAAKRFRADLYYRLKGVEITVPPLRERREDIDLLAEHFMKLFSEEHRRSGLRLSTEALRTLKRYDWPGNIRELKHIIESVVLLSDDNHLVQPAEIPLESGDASEPLSAVQQIEKNAILNALYDNHFNRSLAAKALEISRKTLYTKMKKYAIDS
jgi:DNA-binding NtrC family response regulator